MRHGSCTSVASSRRAKSVCFALVQGRNEVYGIRARSKAYKGLGSGITAPGSGITTRGNVISSVFIESLIRLSQITIKISKCTFIVIYSSIDILRSQKAVSFIRTTQHLMPPSHQSLNMFKSCFVKHGLKLFAL